MLLTLIRNINKDILNTGLVNIIRMATGLLSVLLIPIFLTKQIQGYWYSFGSISAFSVLADLGFTSIIIQFAAHEYAFLGRSSSGHFEGNEASLQRLFSFFHYVLKRGIIIITISFPILFVIGFFILKSDDSIALSTWLIPWIIFIISSGIYFLLNLLASFFEGCGLIAQIQRQRYICNLINWGIIFLCLFLRMQLFSLAFGMLFSSIFFGLQLWINFKAAIQQFFSELKVRINWNKEILKLLYKYALSFIGGFLIFQLFTPIAFRFYGATFAGKVGISITLIMAVFQVANIWIYVLLPKLNMLVSIKNVKELFYVFKRNLMFAIITFILLAIFAVMLLLLLPEEFSSRFLPIPMIFMLLCAWFLQLIINSLATLSRAHKVEKFVIPSLIMGIYTMITTLLISFYLPSEYFFAGFLSSYIFAFPWFYFLYFKHKKIIIQSA